MTNNNQYSQSPLRLPFDIFDYEQYARNALWIRTKEREVVPFVFNSLQKRYYKEKSNRDIILKARQMGISTFKLGEYFHDTITHPNTSFAVISHEGLATRRLLRIIKLFYQKLPPHLKPEIEYNSAFEMTFPKLNSVIFVGTAGARAFGRGDQLSRLHIAELAFWENAEDLMTGLKECVSSTGKITIESTPNGMGGYFYEEWQKAKTGKGKYQPLFYEWWNDLSYSIPGITLNDITPLSEEEYDLIENKGLTAGQILWRREKIEDIGENNFKQEYPENDIDCFLTDTRRVFDVDIVRFQERFIENPVMRCDLTINGLIEHSQGSLRIWRFPQSGKKYVIGADVAEGLGKGNYCCAEVVDITNFEQVACWHSHIDPDLFAIFLARLGKFYNNALIVPEINNHGLTTLNTLLKGSVSHKVSPYKHIYARRVLDEDGKKTAKLGWKTTKTTKHNLIDDLNSSLRQREIIIHEKELLSELSTYIENPDGSMEATTGCQDDRVIAIALTLQGKKSVSSTFSFEEEYYEPVLMGEPISGY